MPKPTFAQWWREQKKEFQTYVREVKGIFKSLEHTTVSLGTFAEDLDDSADDTPEIFEDISEKQEDEVIALTRAATDAAEKIENAFTLVEEAMNMLEDKL